MMLGDTSFGLYLDANLTTLANQILQTTHKSDLSDGDQDFVYYLGSNSADKTLKASSNPGVDNITLTPTDILPEWVASTAYSIGDIVQPTVSNGRRYKCTTAGTSDASEPAWPTGSIGDQVVDGSCVWEFDSFKHEETEVKLALTSGDLASAIAGGALSLGTEILSGVANAVEVHVRITNAVTNEGSNIGTPAISIRINGTVQEDV